MTLIFPFQAAKAQENVVREKERLSQMKSFMQSHEHLHAFPDPLILEAVTIGHLRSAAPDLLTFVPLGSKDKAPRKRRAIKDEATPTSSDAP